MVLHHRTKSVSHETDDPTALHQPAVEVKVRVDVGRRHVSPCHSPEYRHQRYYCLSLDHPMEEGGTRGEQTEMWQAT